MPEAGASAWQPLEQLAIRRATATAIRIGIPRERSLQERRVALTPSSIQTLIARGHQVFVEHRAGEQAAFPDRIYTEAGATIVYSPEDLFQNAEYIVKITPLSEKELDLLRPKQIVFSAVHLGSIRPDHLKKLLQKNITAVGYEFLQAKDGSLPIMRIMSEIAGYSAIQIAAELLAREGRSMLLGGITGVPPAKVVILGAGTVALHACRTASALGCDITVLDEEVYRLQRLKSLLGDYTIATGLIQPDILYELLPRTDVLIGALYRKGAGAHLVVTSDMVARMPEGSLIVDVAIDQGGNIETSIQTTHELPTFTKYGVIHYGVPNIPSRVAHTASIALSNVLLPILLRIGDYGGLRPLLRTGHMLRTGVYTYHQHLTNHTLARLFGMEAIDVDVMVV
jgi:alanine dehydrogenase